MTTTQLQLRRGTTADHSSFTGAQGEITFNTTTDRLHAHDGSTVGGFPVAILSDLSTLVTSSQVSSDISSALTGYVTSSELTTALSGYVSTTALPGDLSSFVTNTSLNNTLSNYVTTSNLATELSSYVTSASLSSYVTSTSLSTSLSNYVLSSTLATDLSNYVTSSTLAGYNYATQAQLSSTIGGYVTTSSLTSTLANYATTASLGGYVTSSTLGSYVSNASLSTTLVQYVNGATFTSTIANYVQTANNHDIPSGGSAGQVLIKNSSTNYDASWSYPKIAAFTTVANSAYTFALTDQYVRVTNTTATVLTIPLNSSVAFPIGTQITVVWVSGSTSCTIAPTSGVTLLYSDTNSMRKAGSALTLTKVATDSWDLAGDMVVS